MKFSANLGFLWADRPLPNAIRAAKAQGFDAVECHWPYDTPPADTAAALHETGLAMLGLNTSRGNMSMGENGLSALPGREAGARAVEGHGGGGEALQLQRVAARVRGGVDDGEGAREVAEVVGGQLGDDPGRMGSADGTADGDGSRVASRSHGASRAAGGRP